MKIICVIPARYASTRLPGKPLADIAGKPMIVRVYERVLNAIKPAEVIAAVDDERVYEAVAKAGGKAIMTAKNHPTGTDRLAEVAQKCPNADVIINVQGDEPLIKPESIDEVIKNVKEDYLADISTLVRVLTDEEEINNPNLVKCVRDINGFALYFSRSKIPYERNTGIATFYGHLGIYGYKRKALEAMTTLAQTPLEKTESLEQLRALENGMKIKSSVVDFVPVGIDTREDLEKFKQIVESKLGKN